MRRRFVTIFATLLLAGCTLDHGKYGLLVADEPIRPERKSVRIVRDPSIPLEGKACSRIILLFIPIELGMLHMDRAVREPVEALRRPDVVGIADAKIETSFLMVPPFYMHACWHVEGVAARAIIEE